MFFKIDSSGNKSPCDALSQVVGEERAIENIELPPLFPEAEINDEGAEEIKKILGYPGIPIQTPVPLRIDKSMICQNARTPQSPIYWVCTQLIFDLLPTKWFDYPVDTWEGSLLDCEESLKQALLHEYAKEEELSPKKLKRLAEIGLNNLKNILKTCSKDSLSLLAKKRPFDVEEIIRINVERNPTLDPNALVTKLYPLIVLINKTSPSWDKLIFYTNFLKEISKYPSPKDRYPIHDSDKIYLFLEQLERSTLKGPAFAEKEKSPVFLDHLKEISPIIGEELYGALTDQIKTYISDSKNDERSTEYAKYQRDLWLKCGDALFGASPFCTNLPIFKEVCSLLKSLPPLTTHPKAVELINNTLLGGKSALWSVILYKSWWFGAYLRDHPHSVAAPHTVKVSDPLAARHSLAIPHSLPDRMVDWYMHQFLEDSRKWELSKTVQLVKFLFQEHHPLLPFNTARAERVFFSLKLDTHSFLN